MSCLFKQRNIDNPAKEQRLLDDAEKLLKQASKVFESATTAEEQREAAIIWLRCACEIVGSQYPGDSSGVGQAIAAALQALSLGTPVAMLSRPKLKTRRTGDLAAAKARAVAAVDLLIEIQRSKKTLDVRKAIAAVAKMNGMDPTALRI